MTVKELIEVLKEEDPKRIVVMSKDSEGNNFSPLSSFSLNIYKAETTWYGDIGLEELTPELRKAGYEEDDVISGEKALVFWPVN